MIEIHGSGFSQNLDENYIQFGDTECLVTFSTNTVVHCTLSSSYAGSKPLHLHVSSTGIANTSSIVLDYSLELQSVTPSRGSIAGGTQLTITGHGFYDSSLDGLVNTNTGSEQLAAHHSNEEECCNRCWNIVTMGDSICDIIQSSRTTLTILTPIEINASVYDMSVTVVCSNGSQASSRVSQTLAGAYTYDMALTPLLSGVQPSEGTIQGGEMITLFGSSFSNVADQNTVKVLTHICTV